MIALLIVALIAPVIVSADVSTEIVSQGSTDDTPGSVSVTDGAGSQSSSEGLLDESPSEAVSFSPTSTEGYAGSEPAVPEPEIIQTTQPPEGNRTTTEVFTIPPSERPPALTPGNRLCGPNETYKEDTPIACGEIKCGLGLPFCCASSIVSQCFCKDDYQRGSNGHCVLPSDCPLPGPPVPHKCGRNEHFRKCESSNCGERKCGEPEPVGCTYDCVYKCFCKPGFFRTPDGDCVRKKNCPRPVPPKQKCGPNETFKKCASSSCGERRCGEPKPVGCTLDCVHGCFCKRGFFRNFHGFCVRKSKCTPQVPGRPVFRPRIGSL